jgi:DNA-binding Lrp family transcriptional regulator
MRNERSIDLLDRAIIAELEEDARLSNTELARRVGLTPAPCLRRVQRLERDGVIQGYHAAVDARSYDRGLEVIVAIDIAVNDGETIVDFESAAVAVPEVTEVRRMFGQPDYYLRVQVADPEAYEALAVNTLARLPAVSRLLSHQTMRLLKGRGAVDPR